MALGPVGSRVLGRRRFTKLGYPFVAEGNHDIRIRSDNSEPSPQCSNLYAHNVVASLVNARVDERAANAFDA